MDKFIIFKTFSQAKNYVKRQKTSYHWEGCGCCSSNTFHRIDKNKKLVLEEYSGENRGSYFCKISVVGRIK